MITNTATTTPAAKVWRDGKHTGPAVEVRHGRQIVSFATLDRISLADCPIYHDDAKTDREAKRIAREINAEWSQQIDRIRRIYGRNPNAKDQSEYFYARKLAETLTPGQTVHASIVRVSSSGMSRIMNLYSLQPAARRKGYPAEVRKDWLSRWIFEAGIESWSDRPEGLRVSGCGMDMGFHVVYTLGHVVSSRCPRLWARKCAKAKKAGASWPNSDTDGGYSLRSEWF